MRCHPFDQRFYAREGLKWDWPLKREGPVTEASNGWSVTALRPSLRVVIGTPVTNQEQHFDPACADPLPGLVKTGRTFSPSPPGGYSEWPVQPKPGKAGAAVLEGSPDLSREASERAKTTGQSPQTSSPRAIVAAAAMVCGAGWLYFGALKDLRPVGGDRWGLLPLVALAFDQRRLSDQGPQPEDERFDRAD
jgi:hypothetical protein